MLHRPSTSTPLGHLDLNENTGNPRLLLSDVVWDVDAELAEGRPAFRRRIGIAVVHGRPVTWGAVVTGGRYPDIHEMPGDVLRT
ncbi:MAG: hypothetical protein ABWY29_03515 [Blastococcus sp.]